MLQKFFLVLLFTNLYSSEFWDNKVQSFGNFTNAIKDQGSGDSINLKELVKTNNIYGIGLTEYLQSEILILNNRPYITSVSSGKVQIETNFNHQAAFLVYTNVPQWKTYKVPFNIYTKKQFEEFLEELAEEEGIDTYKPFPFILEGLVKASRIRIMTHNKNDQIITGVRTCSNCNEKEMKKIDNKKYLSSTLYKTIQNKSLEILGFFYYKRGIITHESSYTYLNYISKDKKLSGHMLNMMIGKDMIVKLPKIN